MLSGLAPSPASDETSSAQSLALPRRRRCTCPPPQGGRRSSPRPTAGTHHWRFPGTSATSVRILPRCDPEVTEPLPVDIDRGELDLLVSPDQVRQAGDLDRGGQRVRAEGGQLLADDLPVLADQCPLGPPHP